jgi:hypothetical protein
MPEFLTHSKRGDIHHTSTEHWPLGVSAPTTIEGLILETQDLEYDEELEQILQDTVTKLRAKPAEAKKSLSNVERYAKKQGYEASVGELASDIARAFSWAIGKFRKGNEPTNWAYTLRVKNNPVYGSVMVQIFPKGYTPPSEKLIVRPPNKSNEVDTRAESYTMAARLLADNPDKKSVLVRLPDGMPKPISLSGDYLVTLYRHPKKPEPAQENIFSTRSHTQT